MRSRPRSLEQSQDGKRLQTSKTDCASISPWTTTSADRELSWERQRVTAVRLLEHRSRLVAFQIWQAR